MASVTVQHAKQLTIGDMTGTITVFNSAGTTTTANVTDIVLPSNWNSSHGVTLSLSQSDMYQTYQDMFEPFPLANADTALMPRSNGSWYIDPVYVPQAMDNGNLRIFYQNGAAFAGGTTFSAVTTGSMSKTVTFDHYLGIYTQGTGANNTQLSRIYSTSARIIASEALAVTTGATNSITGSHTAYLSFPAQWDVSGNVTYSTTSQSGSTSVGASTGASSLFNNVVSGVANYISGSIGMVLPWVGSAYPGQYFVAHMMSSASASAGTNYTQGTCMGVQSVLALSEHNLQAYKQQGKSTTSANSHPLLFHGYYATTSGTAPLTIGTGNVSVSTNAHKMYYNMIGMTLPQ